MTPWLAEEGGAYSLARTFLWVLLDWLQNQ